MDEKKVSVIIPAYNEEKLVQRIIKAYKSESYPLEVIVVVNNSNDRTYEIAQKYADKVLNFPEKIGVCKARNEGAKIAQGEILIFSDADSFLEEGGVKKIVASLKQNEIGSVFGKEDKNTLMGKIFFFFRNWLQISGIFKAINGGVIVFCKNDFLRIGGFNEKKTVAEFDDIIKRGKKINIKYKLIKNCYVFVSMRRYEDI
jgi:glycosyltransferase involved in cell wall biosynthesis